MRRKKKRILAILLLILCALTVQMNPPAMAVEFEIPDLREANAVLLEQKNAQDITFSLMKQRGGEPYVITNDDNPSERYGMTSFAELNAKITELAALTNAYTLTLNQDLTVPGNGSFTFIGPSTWTVEGNNNTVKKEAGGDTAMRVITIGNKDSSCTVALNNIVIDGTDEYRACRIVDGNTLTLESGAIIQNGYSSSGATTGGIHMNRNTSLFMKPGSKILGNISESTSYYGGAIRMLSGCTVDIDGAEISENRVSNAGGAIWADVNGISLSIKNTIFSDNEAGSDNVAGYGGAIHSAILTTIEGGIFKDNIAKKTSDGSGGGGGAIFMARPLPTSGAGSLTVKDTTFSGNKAAYGGAIYSHLAITIEGGVFEENIATNLGGAIYLTGYSIASLTAEKTTFTQNEAARGGAVFTQAITTIKNGTSFVENEATIEGGAIYAHPSNYSNPADISKYTILTIDGTTVFEKNKASFPYEPPSNYADFLNLLFNRTTFTDQVNPYSGDAVLAHDSLLNNYDINYKHFNDSPLCSASYSFVDADAGTLPQQVLDNLPAGSKAEKSSLVIPESPAVNKVELEDGTWQFQGWDEIQVNIPEQGIEFIGKWKFTPLENKPPTEPTDMTESTEMNTSSETIHPTTHEKVDAQIPQTGESSTVYMLLPGIMLFAAVIILSVTRKRV